jgi:transposase-like protein
MEKHRVPATMLEAVRQFEDPQVAHDFFAQIRWPNGIACPRMGCGSAAVAYLAKHRRWYCNDCKKQFSAKVGTIFEDSPIGLDKWLPTIWLIASNRNGISSHELARALDVTQKTAWFMLHRVREAMGLKQSAPLTGHVEADETWIGGKLRNSNKGRRILRAGGRFGPQVGKTAVFGIVQRGGDARAWVVPRASRENLVPKLVENVHHDAHLHTDSSGIYAAMDEQFLYHDVVNHAVEYVRGNAHVNNVEGFWSVLKRTLGGTYIHVMPKHLDRYLNEQIFRFSERKNQDGPRFAKAVKATDGKRVTYKELTGKGLVK